MSPPTARASGQSPLSELARPARESGGSAKRSTRLEIELAARLRGAGCVFAEEEAALLADAASGPDLEALVARRVAGEPLEHVLRWAEFCGLRVAVDPGVFVPRRRTGLLVDLAVRKVRDGMAPGLVREAVVVDLCCGSGAIGAVLAHRLPLAEVYAADLDPAAVACARRNLPRDRVLEGDLYDALPVDLAGRVDVLVVNAPYVPTEAIATMPAEARDHEPHRALDGGPDGVSVHRRVADGAAHWLAPGGSLLIESGRAQADLTASACTAAGLAAEVVTDDDLGAAAVVATRPR